MRDRYAHDFLFRTQIRIVALQLFAAVVLLAFVWLCLMVVEEALRKEMLEGISAVLSGGTPGERVSEHVRAVRTEYVSLAFACMLGLALLLGCAVSRVAIAPAKQALAAQKRFIADIAHELRTPLSVIRTNTEVLMLRSEIPIASQRIMQDNVEELERAAGIINNLITFNNFYRTERITFENIVLSEIVAAMVHTLAEYQQTHKVKIVLRSTPPTTVWGNKVALGQVVYNLVQNAISFTEPGGSIIISCAPLNAHYITLDIEDTGVGIARDDLVNIFKPFYKADRSRHRTGASSGLGLAIVSEILKLHRGKITIRSTVGQGTRVHVELPAGKVLPSKVEEPIGDNEISEDFTERAQQYAQGELLSGVT